MFSVDSSLDSSIIESFRSPKVVVITLETTPRVQVLDKEPSWQTNVAYTIKSKKSDCLPVFKIERTLANFFEVRRMSCLWFPQESTYASCARAGGLVLKLVTLISWAKIPLTTSWSHILIRDTHLLSAKSLRGDAPWTTLTLSALSFWFEHSNPNQAVRWV